jgi:hypothetical protein
LKQGSSFSEYELVSKTSDIKKSELSGTLVKIQDYNPSTHRLKIVSLETGEPFHQPMHLDGEIDQSKTFDKSNSKVLKTLAAPDAPIIEVNDSQASLRGSKTNGFFSTREFGNIVKGPTSFSAQPHEIRIGGIMTLNPLLMTGFASTMVTPIPTFQWSLPVGAMLGPIVKDIALISTLVGALG